MYSRNAVPTFIIWRAGVAMECDEQGMLIETSFLPFSDKRGCLLTLQYQIIYHKTLPVGRRHCVHCKYLIWTTPLLNSRQSMHHHHIPRDARDIWYILLCALFYSPSSSIPWLAAISFVALDSRSSEIGRWTKSSHVVCEKFFVDGVDSESGVIRQLFKARPKKMALNS